MARMLGRARPPQCPTCRAAPGPDCIDKGAGKRKERRIEDREWRDEVDAELADQREADADDAAEDEYRRKLESHWAWRIITGRDIS